jgi:NADH-quinone oxidoreductase subunit J
MLQLVLFYIFAAIAVVSAILVVTRQNIVHSAAFLGATLFAVAGIFLTLRAEFLAGVQVIVYVGGVLVLFVFVIMLISVERAEHERQFNRQWTIALVTSAILIAELAYGFYQGKDSLVLPAIVQPVPGAAGNSEQVGTALYTTFLLPFEIASVLLLVAIGDDISLPDAQRGTIHDRRDRCSDAQKHHGHSDVDRVDDECGQHQSDCVLRSAATGHRSGVRNLRHHGCGCRSCCRAGYCDCDVQEQGNDEHQRNRPDEVVNSDIGSGEQSSHFLTEAAS